MSKSFCSTDSTNNQTDTWFTPKKFIDALGPFDFDPCTQSFRPFDTAKEHVCEDLGEDGLAVEWKGKVWMNCPYGKAVPIWLNRLYEHGNGIALVFARTETKWGQEALRKADAVNFIKGRISFIPNEEGKKSTSAGAPNMLLAYGEQNVRTLLNIPGLIFLCNKKNQK